MVSTPAPRAGTATPLRASATPGSRPSRMTESCPSRCSTSRRSTRDRRPRPPRGGRAPPVLGLGAPNHPRSQSRRAVAARRRGPWRSSSTDQESTMVRILLDPSMYHPHLSIADECRKAADLGYEYLELSPRADFHEWHHYPKVDDAQIAQVKQAMAETGVKIWTFNPVFNWSSPDEDERQAQVRNWRRLLEIAQKLEVPLIPPELAGHPPQPLRSEHQFYRSIEELIPDFEKRGIACTVEAHPYDFAEINDRAVQIVRGVNKPWFNYEFCCPHLFHLSQGRGDARAMME